MRIKTAFLGILLFFASLSFGDVASDEEQISTPSVAMTAAILRSKLPAKIEIIEAGLSRPWGMAYLPDHRLLITQKTGEMIILDPALEWRQDIVAGLPDTTNDGQGGLLDVVVDPDFESEPWVYWVYSEPGTGPELGLSGAAVARGRLQNLTLTDVEIIFRQSPKLSGADHFGSRLIFRDDKTLFITLGDRRQRSIVQDGNNTVGKIIRINRDGSLPPDNPEISGFSPTIWSYGHRNPQGAALRPNSDVLWISEHGPRGGDEINKIEAGRNYGWPNVSYGCEYGDPDLEGCQIGGGRHQPEYTEPATYWEPLSIATSGMIFYQGAAFPDWRGNIFVGALADKSIWRLEVEGDEVVARESMFGNLQERVRDIEEGPDGLIYFITDSGKLYRAVP